MLRKDFTGGEFYRDHLDRIIEISTCSRVFKHFVGDILVRRSMNDGQKLSYP
jgi:hypothetical protein